MTRLKSDSTATAISVSLTFMESRKPSAKTAVTAPPTISTRPVPTRFLMPSASVMTRERSTPVFVWS